MPPLVTADEYFTADGTPSATPAWRFGISQLLGPADQKGEDIDIPEQPGREPHPNELDESERQIQGWIFGGEEPDGTPQTYPRSGLFANLAAFNAAFMAPPGGDGTRDVVVYTDDGAAIASGRVKFVRLSYTRLPTALRCTLTVVLPDGELAAGS